MSTIITFILLVFFQNADQEANTPVTEQIQTVNEYIEFVNESIHGLLIVHRLLENNNQDINKYVDLQGYQLNYYSNSDLPKNIFIDPDKWFYEQSPSARFTSLISRESGLPAETDKALRIHIQKMHDLCNDINNIRFQSEDYIKSHDLTNKEDLYGVYEILENGVTYYEEFYKEQIAFSKTVKAYFGTLDISTSDSEFNALYEKMKAVHDASFNILHSVRIKNEDLTIRETEKLKAAYSSLYETPTGGSTFTASKGKVKEIISSTEEFLNNENVQMEYKLYGKYYYYHNSNIINKFNRYGNGFVNEMNKAVKEKGSNHLMFLEVPHFYQVIYPIKLTDAEYIASDKGYIEAIPEEFESRKISSNTVKISPSDRLVHVKLYDHKLKDGDVVSINFNGEWIYKELSLEKEAREFVLKLNDTGKNYILIHTENEGLISPNTTAFTYRVGELVEEMILQSDMQTSALVEFSAQ